MKATKVNAGLAESNGSLLPGLWRDLLHVTCGLTVCTPGSAPGPTLGNEYGKSLPLPLLQNAPFRSQFLKIFFASGGKGHRPLTKILVCMYTENEFSGQSS